LTLTVFIALGFIFLLARENGELKSRLNSVSSDPVTGSEAAGTGGFISGPPELQTGDLVPSFSARNLGGGSEAIKFDGKQKYFFYLFSAFCGTCMTQVGSWSSMSAAAKAGGYQPVGISLEDPGKKLDTLLQLKDVSTLLIMPDMAIQRSFRATSIPMLALVNANGKVEWSHYGILTDQIKADFSARIEAEK
jgi:hypothetical protein